MGTLKPNTQYIYESPDGGKTVYAREFGSSDKKIIGYQYNFQNSHISQGQQDLENHQLWTEIRQAARTNTALQKAMERVILVYRLSKDNPL